MDTPTPYSRAALCRDASNPPQAPGATQLEGWRQLAARYPYLTLASMMQLRYTPAASPQHRTIAARVALNSPDIQSLLRLTDPDGQLLADFYPADPQPATPSTTEALDTFLDTYGKAEELTDETRLLEKILFNPVPADYALTLADSPDQTSAADEQDMLLDAFLAKQNQAAQRAGQEHQSEPPAPTRVTARADDPLSESLAAIYTRQGRYDKAYEIIRQLSLTFPKKSIYFADQLRFLRKLMLNAQAGGKKQPKPTN